LRRESERERDNPKREHDKTQKKERGTREKKEEDEEVNLYRGRGIIRER